MTLTHEDLQAIGTLMDNKLVSINEKLELIATKDDVQSAKMELYNELSHQYAENDKRFTKLESMANTLLLQSDNTALLLRLINRQAEELEAVKAEVQEIKKRLA